MTLDLPMQIQVKFFIRLGKCAPSIGCVLIIAAEGAHCQIIISNSVLRLSHSLFSNTNELQSEPNNNVNDYFTIQ